MSTPLTDAEIAAYVAERVIEKQIELDKVYSHLMSVHYCNCEF